MPTIRSLCVYCGSRAGTRTAYRHGAARLGTVVGRAGVRLVYGGAHVGLMGALADAALAAGGDVLGVIPRDLADREVAHPGLSELQVVDTMHARKLAMSDAADAFIALPGGLGTLEELFETLTWHQLGWHDKPCGLLDVDGFYRPLHTVLTGLVDAGFVLAGHVERLVIDAEPESLLSRLMASPGSDGT